MKAIALVFVGAGFGAVCRYLLGSFVQGRVDTMFPIGTLVVNVSGSLLIGLVMGVLLTKGSSEDWRLLLVTGLLGGYTTFSAFSYEAVTLIQNKHLGQALSYALLSCCLTILACGLGLWLARALLPAHN